MRSRCLNIDWRAVEGASQKKRVLHLTPEPDNTYMCPIKTCLHDAYRSVRGVRKHVESIHSWYFYFDEKPRLQRQEAVRLRKVRLKSYTHKMPAFSITEGIGCDFHKWLQTSCGGGKALGEATQQARRGMKFLMYALGEPSTDATLTNEFVDCCLGTPSVIITFLQSMEEKWELSFSASLNYMRAVNDLMDFRKSAGVTDNVLRSFTVTEVYLRRGIGNIARKKKINYSRNLDLEQLIARNSWATIEEMEKVIPHHAPQFQDIVRSIKDTGSASLSEISFATRFIITFLFLRVKCTRPMSYRYLTVTQFDVAKSNGGFIDQTTFKTHATYGFDTIILSEDALKILDTYIKVIRPLTHPLCDYVLLTGNGKQYSALGTAMSLLVFQAIGKMVHPSRYRQIIESESADRLNVEEQELITKDQRHSSAVAKRIYQKKLSRTVAEGGRTCLQKLCGTEREEHNSTMAKGLAEMEDDSTITERPQAETDKEIVADDLSEPAVVLTDDDKDEDTGVTPTTEVVVIEDNETLTKDGSPPKEEVMDEEESNFNCPISQEVTVSDSVIITTTTLPPTTFLTSNYSQPISVTSMNTLETNLLTTTWASQPISASAVILPSTTLLASTCSQPVAATSITCDISSGSKVTDEKDLEIKKEEAEKQVSENYKLMRFTPEEDRCLTEGTRVYGLSNWSKILKDQQFTFHPCRNRDTLRVRAETIGLIKRKRTTKQRKCKTAV